MRHNLSEINAIIRDRRTIKPEDFSDRKVHREQIELLLDNARWAPTHGMTQPWYFRVFAEDGLKTLGDFHAEAYRNGVPAASFLQRKYDKIKGRPLLASAVIAIGMRRQEIEKIPEIEELAATACAVQNMMLTATAYGLATYWGSGGMTYSDAMRDFLGLGPKDKCMGFLYVGYPGEEWPKGQRRPQEYYSDWITS